MPSGDRTGPEGAGARTGRGLGNCVADNTPTAGPRFGRFGGLGRRGGQGRGRGEGRGRCVGRWRGRMFAGQG